MRHDGSSLVPRITFELAASVVAACCSQGDRLRHRLRIFSMVRRVACGMEPTRRKTCECAMVGMERSGRTF